MMRLIYASFFAHCFPNCCIDFVRLCDVSLLHVECYFPCSLNRMLRGPRLGHQALSDELKL